MSRPKVLPKAVSPSEYADDIIQMYQSGLSIAKISKKIRESLTNNTFIRAHEISKFLKERNLLKTRSEIMKCVSDSLHYENHCRICNQIFDAKRYNNIYCKECVPDAQAWARAANHGLSQVDFETMLEKQGHACALCLEKFSDIKIHKNKKTSIVVDHCHKTNTVRGLLCNPCNVAVGYMEKRGIKWIEFVVSYVRQVEI